MPEGDKVYRFAAGLRLALAGQRIVAARAHGPGPVPQVGRIVNRTCTDVTTYGKNLFIHFENGLVIRGHLRMYGTWHVYASGEPWRKPDAEARLVLETPEAVVVNFSAPVLEMLEARALPYHAPLASLGPDLLAPDFDFAEALRRLRDHRLSVLTIGDAIMDQGVMAGVGNIWKHETLFRCGINPWLRVADIPDDALSKAIATARDLLRAAAGLPGPDGVQPRRPSYFTYMRGGQPCRRCFTRLRTARQGRDLRFTAWCPKCQPGSGEEAGGERAALRPAPRGHMPLPGETGL